MKTTLRLRSVSKALTLCIMLLTPLLFLGEGLGVRSFAQPTWVTSGAAIGNVSTYTYPASWAGTTLTLINPSSQDELKVSDVTGSPNGVHIYGVNAAPSITTGITGLGSNDRYFGVFVANGTAPTYTATYYYVGNPYVDASNENNLLLFKRSDNSTTPWADASATLDATANTLTKTSESSRGEYILGLSSGFLPIELLSFDATPLKDNNGKYYVRCNWSTATEINNDYFTIENSQDGKTFTHIGKVDGAGNSSTTLYYKFDDQLPYTDLSYYRLKQTDYDGSFSYSNIIAVYIGGMEIISIYPNPAKDFFKFLVGSTDNTNVKIKVIDVLGRTVIERTDTVSKGVTSKSMDVSSLAQGTYLLQIIMDNKEKTEKQFLIQ